MLMGIEHILQTPLAIAVRRAKSQSNFGRLIGKRQSTIRQWLTQDFPLPAEHVLAVEAETGVSRNLLRPDIYPLGLREGSPFSASRSPDPDAPFGPPERGVLLHEDAA